MGRLIEWGRGRAQEASDNAVSKTFLAEMAVTQEDLRFGRPLIVTPYPDALKSTFDRRGYAGDIITTEQWRSESHEEGLYTHLLARHVVGAIDADNLVAHIEHPYSGLNRILAAPEAEKRFDVTIPLRDSVRTYQDFTRYLRERTTNQRVESYGLPSIPSSRETMGGTDPGALLRYTFAISPFDRLSVTA
ncbi:hypothetical protein HYS00_02275 [Candidatus Microgenomates bacterium]|nr:hypothetical protein [Candidatus Microgenomates bacterium]